MYISIGPSPTIDIIYGLPSDISIGPSPTIDIFFCGLPSDQLLFFRQPSETSISRITSCTHSYRPRISQCIWKCMMPIPLEFYNTCKYINMNIFT